MPTADKWTGTLSFEEQKGPNFLANCFPQTESSNSQKQEEVRCSPWGNSLLEFPHSCRQKISPSANAGKLSWEEKVAGTCPGRLGLLTGAVRKERTELLTEKLGLVGHALHPEFILYRAGEGSGVCRRAGLQL